MADRIDIVVFGATGFTGKYTVFELHRIAKDFPTLTWGIAGRNEEKLKGVLDWMNKKTEDDFSKIPVFTADITDEDSLKKMVEKAKIIINCCGPYRFFGEQLVKACVGAGTHHVDVSGEPQYMESMQLNYNKAAEEKGVYVVSACGLDSIPVDLGVVYIQDKFDGTVNSVKTVLETWAKGDKKGGGIHYGTWHSAIYGLAHWNELRELRRKLYPERLPQFKPKVQMKKFIHKDDVTGKWCLPFPGSDRSVTIRSQRYLYENEKRRPAQIQTYVAFDSLFMVFGIIMFGIFFSIMTKFKIGRRLLLSYPRFFSAGFVSHEGPSEDSMNNTWFSTTFKADGWSADKSLAESTDEHTEPPNKEMVARIKAVNPGYGFTCVALVLSAIMIAKEAEKLPGKGGVIPPGAAFGKTSMMQQLIRYGTTVEIVSTKEN